MRRKRSSPLSCLRVSRRGVSESSADFGSSGSQRDSQIATSLAIRELLIANIFNESIPCGTVVTCIYKHRAKKRGRASIAKFAKNRSQGRDVIGSEPASDFFLGLLPGRIALRIRLRPFSVISIRWLRLSSSGTSRSQPFAHIRSTLRLRVDSSISRNFARSAGRVSSRLAVVTNRLNWLAFQASAGQSVVIDRRDHPVEHADAKPDTFPADLSEFSVIDTCVYMYRSRCQTTCRRAARLSSRLLLARRDIGRQCGFEFLQIGREVGGERRMLAQSGEVREGSRILGSNPAMNDWFEAFFLELRWPVGSR